MSLVFSIGLAIQRQTRTAATLPPAAPVNTAPPAITGTAQVGQVLTAGTGTWTNEPTGYAYQWRRAGTAISGAVAGTYTAATADAGSTITVTVTATNAGGSAAATGAATAAVIAAAGGVPVNSAAPAITGTAQVGQTLTATTGTWTNGPTGYAYQWRRGGAAISGATAATYTVAAADVDAVLTVAVGAGNASGSGTPAGSAGTPRVLFAFDLLDQAGSAAITSLPNLRVSLNGGTTWQTLAAAGLTLSREANGRDLRVTGFAGAAARNAALFHFEQKLPGEPNNTAGTTAANLPALFFRRTGGPAPLNTTLPGMSVSATRAANPVGVT